MQKIYIVFFLAFTHILLAKEFTIPGRDHQPTYHIEIPDGWNLTLNGKDLTDTKEPIATITKGDIVIVIHNFPSSSILARIPPLTQMNRWRRQFSQLDRDSIEVTPVAWSGFSGTRFKGTGSFERKRTTIMAWALLIAAQHYNKLNLQQRADVTIKALGPPEDMEKEKNAITSMAESFELIKGIPAE